MLNAREFAAFKEYAKSITENLEAYNMRKSEKVKRACLKST